MNVSLNDELAEIVDWEVKDKKFASRSEFFRNLVREKYVNNKPANIQKLSKNDPDNKFFEESKDAEVISESELFNDV